MAHFLFGNTTWLVVYLLALAVVGVVFLCIGAGIIVTLYRRLF